MISIANSDLSTMSLNIKQTLAKVGNQHFSEFFCVLCKGSDSFVKLCVSAWISLPILPVCILVESEIGVAANRGICFFLAFLNHFTSIPLHQRFKKSWRDCHLVDACQGQDFVYVAPFHTCSTRWPPRSRHANRFVAIPVNVGVHFFDA